MESAVPPHLRCPRSRDRAIPDDFRPPFPAWTARGDAAATRPVMGYLGVQWRDADRAGTAAVLLDECRDRLRSGDAAAANVEVATFVDQAAWNNAVAIGYWAGPEAYEAWWSGQRGWWDDPAREFEGIGLFREVFLPRSSHLETLFSARTELEGVGTLLGRFSDDTIQEHGYWGGMRDRLPASQTDALAATGERRVVAVSPRRRLVASHDGVALIRSGQDWSNAPAEELALYRGRIEPTLRRGMTFLRDEGLPIGCYFNRYMTVDPGRGGKPCRSFGMSAWRDLAALERWAEHHPTHKEIFGDFLEVVQKLAGRLELRLFHEVAVLESGAQVMEYVNCHAGTGMLNGAP